MRSVKKGVGFCVLIALLLIAASCSHRIAPVANSDSPQHLTIEPRQSVQVIPPPSLLLPSDSLDPLYTGLANKGSVLTFYQRRGYKLAWRDMPALADSMTLFINNVKYYGLSPADYHITALDSLSKDASSTVIELNTEVLLTDAFFSIASDLRHGAATHHSDTTTLTLLETVIQKGNLRSTLESLEPTAMGYQTLRHGLKEKLDSLKITGLHSTASSELWNEQIRLIGINLNRWRNEPIAGSRYVLINIPSYTLDVISDDTIIFESPVIVGTPETPTPELSSTIECFVTYPYWHVPRKIAIEEFLPRIQTDSSFIRRNNFDVLDRRGQVLHPDSVDWSKFNKDFFPVSLRQREGTENSLGVIKFVFDNPYAVFLHDTNAKNLFRKKARAFSHGCVRMEKAVEFAHYLATGSLDKKSELVDQSLKEELKRTINVRHPIPIYIRYFTCEWRDGEIHFFKDIYQLDKPPLNSAAYGY